MDRHKIVQLLINPLPKKTPLKPRKPLPNDKDIEDRIPIKRITLTMAPTDFIPYTHYKALFNRLIHQNRKFFTSDYGKCDIDFENYVQDKTDMYDSENPFEPQMPKFVLPKDILVPPRVKRASVMSKKLKLSKKTKLARTENKSGSGMGSLSASTSKYPLPSSPVKTPFEYKLSDPEMLHMGITVDSQRFDKPIKFFIFTVQLTTPGMSWFLNLGDKKLHYPNNNRCASILEGIRTLYNSDGIKSMEFQPGILGSFFIVYSEKKRLFKGKMESFPLAMFDLNGHGVVYDEDGKKRLIYDQAQGILFDSPPKIPIKWKWRAYNKIMQTRDELKFVKPDDMFDIDYEEKLRDRLRRERALKKKRARKPAVVHPESKSDAGIVKKNLKYVEPQVNAGDKTKSGLNPSPKLTSPVKKKAPKIDEKLLNQLFGDTKTLIEKSKQPILIKFSKSGCAIEPLHITCSALAKQSEDKIEQQENFSTKSTFVQLSKMDPKKKSKKKSYVRDLLAKCLPEVESKATLKTETSLIKPIVLKITNTVSLIIMSQEHIHIEFSCWPFHFTFNIGITVNFNELNKLYAVRNVQEAREPIPSFFEVMQNKSHELKTVNEKLKQMRDTARYQYEKSHLAYMKNWGYNVWGYDVILDGKI